jgi:hypothetical protein
VIQAGGHAVVFEPLRLDTSNIPPVLPEFVTPALLPLVPVLDILAGLTSAA